MSSMMHLLYLILVTQCSENDWQGRTSTRVHVLDENPIPYSQDKALRGGSYEMTGSHATSWIGLTSGIAQTAVSWCRTNIQHTSISNPWDVVFISHAELCPWMISTK